jgi:hypothetical protein
MTSANDFVNVNGVATLGGELHLSFLNGFVPNSSETFGILRGTGGVTGAFSNVADGQRLATSDGVGSFIVRYGVASPFDHTLVELTSFVPALAGDYNLNGVVDAADYVLWRNNLGSANSLPNDDTAGVGADDYGRWRTHFGQTAGMGSGTGEFSTLPGGASVPEPSLWLMIAVGTVVRATNRTRRRQWIDSEASI